MLTIQGHSDDIIYPTANGKTIDEYYFRENDNTFLRFPDGTVVQCMFCPESNPKGWDFAVIRNPQAHSVVRQKREERYSDDYELVFPNFSPMKAWCNRTPDGPDEDELDNWTSGGGLEDGYRVASFEKQLQIWRLLNE